MWLALVHTIVIPRLAPNLLHNADTWRCRLASITKRGERQYHVRVRVKGFGVRCKTLASREEARKWAAKVESEMLHGVVVPQDERDRTTLAEALDRYGREVTPAKKGACTEQRRIAQLRRHPLAARYIA